MFWKKKKNQTVVKQTIKTKEKVYESELDKNINSGQGLSKLQANQAYSQNTSLINQSSVPVQPNLQKKRSSSSSSSDNEKNKKMQMNTSGLGNVNAYDQTTYVDNVGNTVDTSYTRQGAINSGYGPYYDTTHFYGTHFIPGKAPYTRSALGPNAPVGKNLYGETGFATTAYSLQQPFPGQTVYVPYDSQRLSPGKQYTKDLDTMQAYNTQYRGPQLLKDQPVRTMSPEIRMTKDNRSSIRPETQELAHQRTLPFDYPAQSPNPEHQPVNLNDKLNAANKQYATDSSYMRQSPQRVSTTIRPTVVNESTLNGRYNQNASSKNETVIKQKIKINQKFQDQNDETKIKQTIKTKEKFNDVQINPNQSVSYNQGFSNLNPVSSSVQAGMNTNYGAYNKSNTSQMPDVSKGKNETVIKQKTKIKENFNDGNDEVKIKQKTKTNVKFNDTTTELNPVTSINQTNALNQGTSLNPGITMNTGASFKQGGTNSYVQSYNQNANSQYNLGAKQQGFQTTYTPGPESIYGTRPVETNLQRKRSSSSSSSSSERQRNRKTKVDTNLGPSTIGNMNSFNQPNYAYEGNLKTTYDTSYVTTGNIATGYGPYHDNTHYYGTDYIPGKAAYTSSTYGPNAHLGKNLYGQTGHATTVYSLQQPFPGQTVYVEQPPEKISESTKAKFWQNLW